MKKIISIFLILFVFASLTAFSLVTAENPVAGNQGQNAPQTQVYQGEQGQNGDQQQGEQQEDGQENQEQEQTQEQGQEGQDENGSDNDQNGQQLRVKTVNEFRSMIQEKRREMIDEIKSMKGNLQKAYQNQNEVRMAVHSLRAAGELVGGVGKEISEVAKQFNNSVDQSIKAEETIRNRSRITRFFAGGDQKTAEELQNLVDQNRIRIQKLKELKGECDCEDEVRTLMQDQIQSMEQGQTKLQELVQNERNARGIWGWFKGLFGK